jgi:hypothetical protein
LWYALAVALAGLVLAALAMLAPWYHGSDLLGPPIVGLVSPAGVARQR